MCEEEGRRGQRRMFASPPAKLVDFLARQAEQLRIHIHCQRQTLDRR
jgi:hypothetical protein